MYIQLVQMKEGWTTLAAQCRKLDMAYSLRMGKRAMTICNQKNIDIGPGICALTPIPCHVAVDSVKKIEVKKVVKRWGFAKAVQFIKMLFGVPHNKDSTIN